MDKAVFIFFALVALVMGVVFGWIGWSSRQEARRSLRLPSLEAQSLATLALGTDGYVAGRFSENSDIRMRDLVLFTRSRLEGFETDDGETKPVWKTLERVWPTLWIDAGNDEMRIAGDYRVVFQGSDPTYFSTPELEEKVTERYEGLRSGQEVVALGKVAEDAKGRYLETEILASGTFEDYLKGERSSARFGLVAGSALLLVALVLVLLAILS